MAGKLEPEEQQVLDSYDDEWESIRTPELVAAYRKAASDTFRKDKRVNIRISGKDLELLQERALIKH